MPTVATAEKTAADYIIGLSKDEALLSNLQDEARYTVLNIASNIIAADNLRDYAAGVVILLRWINHNAKGA
jgi:hypothetical protein